jgi:carbon monoxide dehydrogenase subunit G
MATELDHTFTMDKPIDESFATVTDLERVIPCVEGGQVIETIDDDNVKAEIDVSMGAMSMKFVGNVEVAEKDADAHRAVLKVRSKEAGGQGHADADVTFDLNDDGGEIHTSAKITGKAASMGEGTVVGVLDALINDFTQKLGRL